VTSANEAGTRRRLSRRTSIAVAVVGLLVPLYLVAMVVADKQLTRMLPEALAEAVGGRDAARYTVTVEGVKLSYSLRGVTVRDLRVTLDSAVAAETREPALVRAANLGLLRVSGLRLIPLLLGKGIFVSSIEIDGPVIALDFATAGGNATGSAQLEDAEPTDRWDSPRPPNATLRSVSIRNGSIELKRPTEYGAFTSFLHNLEVKLTEIQIDTVTLANPVSALTNSRVSLAFDTVYHVLDDSLYAVTATGFRAESRDSVIEIGTIQFTPTLEAAPFFGRLRQRADRLGLSAGPIRIEGLDFAKYISDEAVAIRLIEVDSLDLHVHSDIDLDWGPKARPCRYHMGFSEIPLPFRIDTVRVNDGFIRYSELARGSVRPGELTLEEVAGLITNLTNDPDLMTPATPAVVNMTARLFGEGEMEATVRYPLLSPTLDFDIEASSGPMSLTTANRFASNVAGVEVTQGDLDSLWVGLESRDGKATGRVHMRYRDLGFRMFDRNTGSEKVWHSVLGFAGRVATRGSNPGKPEDEPRDGKIDYTCGEDHIVFFEFFVGSLVNGLKRIVLIV
jgi:hypothetical protein